MSLSEPSEKELKAMLQKVIAGLAILFVLVYVFEQPEEAGNNLRSGFDSVVTFLSALAP
jgi:hypothetical protein